MLGERLYLELLFVGAILLGILFINNIFLYKQKLRDRVSLMLIFGVVMSVAEIIWTMCEIQQNPSLRALHYIGAICYLVGAVIFSAILNRYLLERMGIRFSKLALILVYIVPVAVNTLLSLTTPLSHLIFWINEAGAEQTGPLMDNFFLRLMLVYLLSPALIAAFLLTLGKKLRPADGEISGSMIAFGVMIVVLYYLQLLLLPAEFSTYTTASLPVSLSLVYLITNVSTHNALETQAQIEAVETDLRIASKIQADALPPVAPEFANHLDLVLRGSMNTAKEVGGDFFDYFAIDTDRICFLIADVSGKGTPAALFMMTAKTMIKDYALTKDTTAEIFTAVNARLCEGNEAGMFATAWIGILDTRTMTLQYTNAGHNYPILLRKGEPCEEMKKVHGLFLAGLEYTRYKQTEIQLASGDRLLLYTDGVVEAHDKDNGLYGMERMEAVLDSTRDRPGEAVLEEILNDVSSFAAGVPQFDDITMVVLTIK